jgi:hypothetical protein
MAGALAEHLAFMLIFVFNIGQRPGEFCAYPDPLCSAFRASRIVPFDFRFSFAYGPADGEGPRKRHPGHCGVDHCGDPPAR